MSWFYQVERMVAMSHKILDVPEKDYNIYLLFITSVKYYKDIPNSNGASSQKLIFVHLYSPFERR